MLEIVATYTPTDYGTRPAYTVGGKLYRAASIFHLARKLLADGYEWSDSVRCPSTKPRTLGYLATLTISESDKRGIQLGQYQPFDRDAISSEAG